MILRAWRESLGAPDEHRCHRALARFSRWPVCPARLAHGPAKIAIESLGEPHFSSVYVHAWAVRFGLVRRELMDPPEAHGRAA